MDVNLPRDKNTGKTRGFGFLMYEDQRSTILAVDNLNGAKVLDRTLRVDHVKNYKQPKMKGEDGEWEDREEQSLNAKPELVVGQYSHRHLREAWFLTPHGTQTGNKNPSLLKMTALRLILRTLCTNTLSSSERRRRPRKGRRKANPNPSQRPSTRTRHRKSVELARNVRSCARLWESLRESRQLRSS